MRRKRVALIIGGIAAVVFAWLGMGWLLRSGQEPTVEVPRIASGERSGKTVSAGLSGNAGRDVTRVTKQPRVPQVGAQARRPKEQAAGTVKPPSAAVVSGVAQPAAQTGREKAVEVWDRFIEEAAARTGVPTMEEAARFKEEFRKLDAADRMDGIQNALNLLPDGQFSLVYPILFDKTENADILDEIFSDALNRDEEIKVPIMKEIYKDKEHPMFVEAARILDATGELDEMNGDAEKDTPDEGEE